MASIATNKKNGTKRLLYVGADRKRKTMRLGHMAPRAAERLRDKVTQLEGAAKNAQPLDRELLAWAAKLPEKSHDKLSESGLLPKRIEKVVSPTVGKFLADYLAMRTEVASSTARHLREASAKLQAFLGADRPLADVTPLDAEQYRLHLLTTLGENTVRRMVSRARQFFAAAIRGRLLGENPFGHLKGLSVRAVKERQAFIDRDMTYQLLDAAPNAEWRAIIALARFGGVRVPSELKGLRWSDIDWTAGTMTIMSPKTAHCGKHRRVIPLFPELKPWLQEAQDAALGADCTLPEFVIPRASAGSRVNLRTGLERIIAKANLQKWPKLFVNLRSSRATELPEHFPSHVCAEWLGHTEAVANEHYRQTTTEHYARAAAVTTGPIGRAQKRAQSGAEIVGTPEQWSRPAQQKTPVLPGSAALVKGMPNCPVPPDGLEPSTL